MKQPTNLLPRFSSQYKPYFFFFAWIFYELITIIIYTQQFIYLRE